MEAGLEAARPLRVYYRRRRLGTVHPTVRPVSTSSPQADWSIHTPAESVVAKVGDLDAKEGGESGLFQQKKIA